MTLADQIEIVCLMEATARKPGNVHPGAAFIDLRYEDFIAAARAVASPLSAVQVIGLGSAIFDAVKATRVATGSNVNLGIILLLAPLIAVPDESTLPEGIEQVLSRTTVDDAEQVYAAIRLAQPGGMGDVSSQDINDRPNVTLREAMILAANRDRIAEQYANGFALVFEARSRLCELLSKWDHWESAIIHLYLWIMSNWPDTLIMRKSGRDLAEQAAVRAATVLRKIENTEATSEIGHAELMDLDAWLRADGHRRNPGTTADLVVATLFAAQRDGLIELPSREEIHELAARIREE